jgi:hypothetical protein
MRLRAFSVKASAQTVIFWDFGHANIIRYFPTRTAIFSSLLVMYFANL